ncbi:hypothetical protein [Verrucomicrobium sp. BvORR106]|uniref:hypothetical protein n=1 Tax=Verrucomicrobium sp. BvORR106 TaxID=1403819 RepID=UPI00068CDE0A|nr:hypothetical protein [Verrucomicrobium sp. BvORR106]
MTPIWKSFRDARSVLASTYLACLIVCSSAGAQENFLPDGTVAPTAPESVKYTLIKPGDKTSENVKEGERNPFTKGDKVVQSLDQNGTTEENDIRERLSKLRVVGVSPGARGLRVMLGDMVLEPGEDVPQVLPEQSISLRVGNISPRAIELVWVEKKPSGLPPRVLTIPVDLRPYVRSILKGQANSVNQWEKEKPETARGVVATDFPDVAQTSAQNPTQLAQNDRSAPKPPVASATAGQSTSHQAPAQPTADGGDTPHLTLPAVPELEEAMSLLKKLVPLGGGGEKK